MKRKQRAQSTMPIILMIAGAILVVGVLLWQLAQNRPVSTSRVQTVSGPTLTADQIDRVSPVNAQTAFENQAAVLIDVRSADTYAVDHIAGAINIPLAQIGNRASELNKNKWIILYCT